MKKKNKINSYFKKSADIFIRNFCPDIVSTELEQQIWKDNKQSLVSEGKKLHFDEAQLVAYQVVYRVDDSLEIELEIGYDPSRNILYIISKEEYEEYCRTMGIRGIQESWEQEKLEIIK